MECLQYNFIIGALFADLLYARTGDRVWWTWTANEHDPSMCIAAQEQCTSTVANRPMFDESPPGKN